MERRCILRLQFQPPVEIGVIVICIRRRSGLPREARVRYLARQRVIMRLLEIIAVV